MERSDKFSNKIYIIKFICSILVIFSHAYNIEVYKINKDASLFPNIIYMLEKYENLFTTLAVAVFFFISGFLFFHNLEESTLIIKLKKRIKSVLLTYVIWSSIYYIYYCFISLFSFANVVTSHGTYIFGFKSWIKFLFMNQKLTALWFMETLILIMLLTPLIKQILKYKKLSIATILILIAFNLSVLKRNFVGIYDTNYLLYFYIGSYLGYNKIYHVSKKISIISLMLLIIFPLTLPLIGDQYYFVIITIEIMCTWFSADLIDIKAKWWMKETTFTFVFHEIPLEIIEKLILFGFGIKPLFALIDFIVAPILTFVISICIAKVAKKYFNPLYNILI